MNCSCCQGPKNVNDLDKTFDAKGAQADAKRYRKRGLARRSRQLIAPVVKELSADSTVLEIGCGAGGLHQDLLRNGVVAQAVGVDASSGYLAAARENAAFFRVRDSAEYHHTDFAQTDQPFEPANLVVMDRVICCYPYLDQLLGKAAQHASQYLAISYPVDRLITRLAVKAINAALTLFGSGYHPFVHRDSDIVATATAAGLTPVFRSQHHLWQLLVFERQPKN